MREKFTSPEDMLAYEAFVEYLPRDILSFTCLILETRAARFPFTYWKEMLAFEMRAHMTFEKDVANLLKKGTLVHPPVLDSLPLGWIA